MNIHTAKKYFPKIGSSFTWYIVQNTPSYKPINVEGIWNDIHYESMVTSRERRFIPQYYNSIIDSISQKTLESDVDKFKVETTSDLHKYTKEVYKSILDHDLYKFLNNICRWGNFNNIRILQSFPIPTDKKNIWNNFNLTQEEIDFMKENI